MMKHYIEQYEKEIIYIVINTKSIPLRIKTPFLRIQIRSLFDPSLSYLT